MQFYISRNQIFLIIFILLINITACTNKNEAPIILVETGSLSFHLHSYIGKNEVEEVGSLLTDNDGRKIILNTAQLYISTIELIKSDGSSYIIPNTVLLKTMEKETYFAGNVPVGEYKQIKFKIGLSPTTNQKLPSGEGDSILNQKTMWFNEVAKAGEYIFLKVEGKVDTTKAANGSELQMLPFSYKIGTNNHFKEVVMPVKSFVVAKKQESFAHYVIDYAQLFKDIRLFLPANLRISSIEENKKTVSDQIVNNIPNMFKMD